MTIKYILQTFISLICMSRKRKIPIHNKPPSQWAGRPEEKPDEREFLDELRELRDEEREE